MENAPPIILVLDISTLSATSTREWLGFSRAGACYIPQVVYEEMRFLYERSPDPDLERVARDFNRFYSTSGWRITEVVGHHNILKSATGYGLTTRMRVALAVARTAYGLAEQYPKSLVVLVANDRSILQRIYDIKAPNLAGIPVSSLIQWCKTGQRPIAVNQKLHLLKESGNLEPISSTIAYTNSPKSSAQLGKTRSTSQTMTGVRKTYRPLSRTKRKSSRSHSKRPSLILPDWLPQFASILSACIALGLATWVIWLIFFTDTLNQFLPNQPQEPLGNNQESVQ